MVIGNFDQGQPLQAQYLCFMDGYYCIETTNHYEIQDTPWRLSYRITQIYFCLSMFCTLWVFYILSSLLSLRLVFTNFVCICLKNLGYVLFLTSSFYKNCILCKSTHSLPEGKKFANPQRPKEKDQYARITSVILKQAWQIYFSGQCMIYYFIFLNQSWLTLPIV